MESIVEFPDREIIEDEALSWLIRLDGDQSLSPKEEQALDAWLARSPAHREALTSANRFWANANVLGELAPPQSVMDLCRKSLRRWLWPDPGQRLKPALGLSFVLTLGLALSLALDLRGIGHSNGVYMTAVGQQQTLTLADNSVLQLNTNSQIQVDFSDQHRNIRLLQGEVHFQVAKDPSKPFRVYAGNGRVQAVGTAFNIHLQADNVEVLVTEGRIALASTLPVATPQPRAPAPAADPYAKTTLNGLGTFAAGEALTLKKVQGPNPAATNAPAVTLVQASPAQVARHKTELAWRRGLLIFNGQALSEVIAEVERYTTVAIDIVDPELGRLAVGGQIKVADTDAMFAALEANFGLRIKRLSYNHVQVIALEP